MDKMTIAHSITLTNVIDNILFVGDDKKERDLPFNVKYKLQRNADLLLKDYAYYETERTRLIKKYGKEEDQKIVVTEENKKEYQEELLKVISLEVEHPLLKLVPADVDSIGDVKVAVHEMDLFIALMVDDPDLEKDLKTPIKGTEEVAETVN